jgi:outer membrane protein assembly factor BamA
VLYNIFLSLLLNISPVVPDTLTAPALDFLDTVQNPYPVIVSEILISGNKVTKERIVLREISVNIGDTIAPGKLAEVLKRSRYNIYNTGLFNFVTIVTEIKEEKYLTIRISLIERWYLWPIPVFELAETNFNTWWLTKDFSRANYGLFVTKENFRGRKEALRFKVQGGYTEQYAVQYIVPYINKKQTIGLGATVSYYRNREIVFGTTNNKRLFLTDRENFARTEFYSKMNLTYRKNLYNTSSFMVKYSSAEVSDTLLQLSNDYFPLGSSSSRFITLAYNFKHDRRDVRAYPLKGHYAEFEIVKAGLGTSQNSPDLTYFLGNLKKFIQLHPKWFVAAGVKGKWSLDHHQPYYLQRGLGYYDEMVRGYEYYVVDGQRWAMGRSNIKYELVRPRVSKLPFVGTGKFSTIHYGFYLNAFADAGYVEDRLYYKVNPLANTWMAGYGIGLDYVTYYDQSIRFEYSINKLGERGFFINFTSPI